MLVLKKQLSESLAHGGWVGSCGTRLELVAVVPDEGGVIVPTATWQGAQVPPVLGVLGPSRMPQLEQAGRVTEDAGGLRVVGAEQALVEGDSVGAPLLRRAA